MTFQLRDLENGRVDPAVSRFKRISPLAEEIFSKSLPQDPSGGINTLVASCLRINDRIETEFGRQARQISREIIELQVEQQLEEFRREEDESSR